MKTADFTKILELCADHGCEEIAKANAEVYIDHFSPQSIELPIDLEEAIEKEWEKEVALEKSKGREPLNNTFVEVLSHKVTENGKVALGLCLTDWKHYNSIKKIAFADAAHIIWGIGTAGFTYFRDQKSGENVYVFATRDATKVSDIGGKLETPPAGYLNPSCTSVRGPLAFTDDLAREFEEELGLPRDRIVSQNLINLIRIPRTHDYSVDYSLEVRTSAEELQEGFRKGKKYGGEHSGHFLIPEHELRSFMEKYVKIMPPRTKCDIKNYLLAHSGLTEH